MLFCSAQFKSYWENPGNNLFFAEKLIAKAAQRGADLIAFSEQFLTGWNPVPDLNIEDISGLTISALKKAARENCITVISGFREKNEKGLPYNSVVVIDSYGMIKGVYRKIHLFSPLHEDEYYTRGDSLLIFEIKGVRIGLAICYDLRFAELFLAYEKRGVDLVIIPASWPEERILHWKILIQSRSVDFGLYVAGVNALGETPYGKYNGNSMIVTPDGTVISDAQENETLTFKQIEPKISGGTWQMEVSFHDRREDLYPVL